MIKEIANIVLNYSIPCAYQNVFYNTDHLCISATIVNPHKYHNYESICDRKYYNYREINKHRYYSICGANGLYTSDLPQRYFNL